MTDTAARHARHRLLLIGLTLFGVIGIPGLYLLGVIDIETVNTLGRYLTYAMVAIGLDLIWGYAGILSLCQALFFAIGAYAMGMYMAHQYTSLDNPSIPQTLYVVYPFEIGESTADAVLPWFWVPFKSFPVALVLAIVIPAAVAALIGFFGFISRVRGVYFAILTQALAVAACLFFGDNNMCLCGTNGMSQFKTFLGVDLGSENFKLTMYLVSLFATIGVYLLCRFIVQSRFGRILVAIRDSESTLRFAGYKPHQYKLFVFTLSAAIAGLAGALYVPQMQIITPSDMGAIKSILIVVWVAVGGRGTLSGAILGALVVNLLYKNLTSPIDLFGLQVWKPDYWLILLGTTFVCVVMFFPNGLVSVFGKIRRRKKTADIEASTKPVGAAS
ncbi:MAG: urea transport system permease protein [Kiritimatiellia bacterium]|jgi:urea transport system permease protein